MPNNFIYRESAPGQQAVQYAQLQEQADADRRRILAQTYRDMSTQGTEMARTNAQMAATRSQMNQRSAEAEKDRALQREGYKSAETVAAGRAKAAEDAWDKRAKAQTDFETAETKRQAEAFFQAGETDAAMMNDPKVPQALKDKIAAGRNVRPGPNGLWVNAHPNPALQLPGVQTIDDIKRKQADAAARNRALVQPGAVGDVKGNWGNRVSEIKSWKNQTSPVAPRTSMGRDGWQSLPPPDAVVPRAPFDPNVPVDNDPRAHSFGPEPAPSLRSYDFNSPTNGYREWFPPDYSWPPVDNDPRAHSDPSKRASQTMIGEIPLDERFDEPTYGFTGFDRLNNFGRRITENSSDAIIRRFSNAKKSNPNIKLIKKGGGIDQISGRQIPEQYFIQPAPEPALPY